MKRFLTLFFCLCLAAVSAQNAVGFSTSHDPMAAVASDTYTKAEVDSIAAASSLRYYFQSANDPILTTYELFADTPAAAQSSEAMPAMNTSTYVTLETYITPVGAPNLSALLQGSYDILDYFTSSGNSGAYADIYYELSSRTVGGVETVIASSTPFRFLGGQTKGRLDASIALPNLFQINLTDRLILRSYGKRSSTIALTHFHGDGTAGYFGAIITSRSFMRTDGSNASDTISLKGINASSRVLIATSTDDGVNKLQVNGFTKLGEAATGIKMKMLTGTTGDTEGSAVGAAFGLPVNTKIVSYSVQVEASGYLIPQEHSVSAGYQYSTSVDNATVVISNSSANSENVLSKPFTVLIWYKE